MLGEHRHVGVVRHVHGQLELRVEARLQVDVGPAEVGRRAHHPERVDDTGRADADAEHRGSGAREEPADEVGHERHGRVAGGAVEGDLGARHDAAVEVDDRAEEALVLGEVDAHDVEGGAVDVDERGGLAGAGVLALAELDHEALGDEAGHEVGDRDPGQAGLARDIRPALRARGVERLQHERAVVAARMLGKHLAGGTEGAGPREDRRTAERCGEHVGTRVGGAAIADLASLRIRRHVC